MDDGQERTRDFQLQLREINVADETLLGDLQSVAARFGNGKASIQLYDRHGKYNSTTLKRRFRSWNGALQRAGLSLNNELNVSDVRLFENVELVWVTFGRQPRLIEMDRSPSEFAGSTYRRRFRSWNNALKAFIAYIEESGKQVAMDSSTAPTKISTQGPRGVDLRMRFRVMLRDNFTCRMCGRSPATGQGVILHVDHIIPWSKNGPTEYANLQTLCDRCNLGKSNLDQAKKA